MSVDVQKTAITPTSALSGWLLLAMAASLIVWSGAAATSHLVQDQLEGLVPPPAGDVTHR